MREMREKMDDEGFLPIGPREIVFAVIFIGYIFFADCVGRGKVRKQIDERNRSHQDKIIELRQELSEEKQLELKILEENSEKMRRQKETEILNQKLSAVLSYPVVLDPDYTAS